MRVQQEPIESYRDRRGKLYVIIKGMKSFGQCYIVTFNHKWRVRGNHYHKEITEWFWVIDGMVRVKLYDLETKRNYTFELSNTSGRLMIKPNIVHRFDNLTARATMINFTDKLWKQSDTIPYNLI
jgi:dTDP-4-dehydrorhamnose 3,5-epimerase-like enzyme